MNNDQPRKSPALLLLLLLAVSCGLLLIQTVNENVSNGGLQTIRDKQNEEKEIYQMLP